MILLGFLHTGAFISQNHQSRTTFEYTKEIISRDPHYVDKYDSGRISASWGMTAGKSFRDYAEAIRSLEIRRKADRSDYHNSIDLAEFYLARQDSLGAAKIARSDWMAAIDDSVALANMISVMARTRNYRDAEKIYDTLIARGKSNYQLLLNLATIKQIWGELDSAAIYFDRAFKCWPDYPVKRAFDFYSDAFYEGYYEIAESGFKTILPSLQDVDRVIAEILLDSIKVIRAGK
jgi:tetratricopeptide (TPR) repeat protein